MEVAPWWPWSRTPCAPLVREESDRREELGSCWARRREGQKEPPRPVTNLGDFFQLQN